MLKGFRFKLILLAICALVAGCQESLIPDGQLKPGEKVYTGCIPEYPDGIVSMYINLPGSSQPEDIRKEQWMYNASLSIEATVNGVTTTVYSQDGVKIKGHGNTTWSNYPKKPYTLKLPEQANFIGTGKTKRWVLLANWMDRTLLRNDVAFEAARRTSLEWTPSGTYVNLYLNGNYNGLYWLGEKIHVEGSHFTCDYLYSYDISDKNEHDFDTQHGHWKNATEVGGIPVELKYPDRDDYSEQSFKQILDQAQKALYEIEDAIMRGKKPSSVLDLNTLCDWYLVNELCSNNELIFPKSTFLYIKNGKLYAGPVWDFDFGTFTPDHHTLSLKSSLYFYQLWSHPEFRKHLQHRWSIVKPAFQQLGSYIDQRASLIRNDEVANHQMWPCYPNPQSESADGLVNGDELLTFDEAVARMKQVLMKRIQDIDAEINRL